jgi:ribosomal-protein-alanine N-acetyltransferase
VNELYPVQISGPRVSLREVNSGDIAAVFDYASNPLVTEHTVWDLHTDIGFTETLVTAWIEQAKQIPRSRIELGVIFENELVGMGRISIEPGAHRRGNIGYVLNPTIWGQGIGSETAALLVEFGFTTLGLHRIWGKARPANTASRRILEKAGMRFEGILRDDLFIKGQYYDMASYAVLEGDVYPRVMRSGGEGDGTPAE